MGSREVSTTIVAFKFSTTFTTSIIVVVDVVCFLVTSRSIERVYVIVYVFRGFEIAAVSGVGVVGGGGGGGEVYAEEADTGGGGGGGKLGGSGPNEGELREGVNVHEIMSLI